MKVSLGVKIALLVTGLLAAGYVAGFALDFLNAPGDVEVAIGIGMLLAEFVLLAWVTRKVISIFTTKES